MLKLKKTILILALLTLSSQVLLFSQTIEKDISMGFGKGKASILVEQMTSNVTYVNLGKTHNLRSNQMLDSLNNFFKSNTPVSFEEIHKSLKGDSGFVIGKLTTSKGLYRIHLLLQKKDQKYLINQIRIENFNE